MNMPAVQQPHVQALAQVLGEVLSPMLSKMDNNMARVCDIADRLQAGASTSTSAVDTHQHDAGAGACALGGKCNGTCGPCKKKNTGVIPVPFVDAFSQIVAGLQVRGCGVCCRPMSPCMVFALQWMLTRVSVRRLYKILELDDDSVEINTFVGSADDFVNITTTPLTSNQSTLLVMSPSQLAPLIPAISKAAVTWEGDPVDSGVTLTLYQGPKGLTNVRRDELKTFAQVGNPKNLTRWFCKDRCFIRPFPPFLGCSGNIVPDTEAIYLEIRTDGSLGQSKLKALPFEVLKAGTYDASQWCKTCGVDYDDWGVPTSDLS